MQLGQLQQLEHLRLVVDKRVADGKQPKSYVLGGLPSLPYLFFGSGTPAPALLDLPSLLSLLELNVSTDRPTLLGRRPAGAAPCAGTAARLQRLLVYSKAMRVDFAALPALTHLHLSDPPKLHGAASVAAATSLRYLTLGGDRAVGEAVWGYELTHPWVPELLRRAPPSLRSLHFQRRGGL